MLIILICATSHTAADEATEATCDPRCDVEVQNDFSRLKLIECLRARQFKHVFLLRKLPVFERITSGKCARLAKPPDKTCDIASDTGATCVASQQNAAKGTQIG